MKRFIILIITLSVLLGCACLTAVADSANGHTHTWKDLDTIEQPTCTNDGWKVQGCAGCGQTRDVRIPALGHEFSQQVYTSYADCTHYGAFYWVCERCGAHSAIGNDKPLGHDWDEGVITTQPHGFTPGVKTYTCRRDPSHTYTEEVDPMGLLFATLEGGITVPDFSGGPADLKDLPPLVIVRQPEKGYVTLGGSDSCTLTVEVEGGEPPYTYEWHMVSHMLDSVSDDTLAVISGGASIDASDWSSMMGSLLGGMLPEWTGSTLMIDVSSEVVGGNSPSLEAYQGNSEYWCRITDSKKQSIESDKVTVGYKIHITEQPHNVNLTGVETALLTCKAADGRVENGYTYTWYDKNGTSVGTGSELEMDLEGEYYCVASDGVDSIPSDKATLYVAEPLRIRYASAGGSSLWPEETGNAYAVVQGGVPPYEVKWEDWNGQSMPVSEGASSGKYFSFTTQTQSAGSYTFTVTDKMEASASKTVVRNDKRLIIDEEPEGGVIPTGGSVELKVRVGEADAELPIRFVLYKDGKHRIEVTENKYYTSFDMNEPGIYYYWIKDAKGHTAASVFAVLSAEELHVVNQTESAELKTPSDTVTLSVEVTGGTPPYTYEWRYRALNSWLKINDADKNALTTGWRGYYACNITDDEEHSTWSKVIPVTYTGEVPLITEQPSSKTVEADENGYVSFKLRCHAISGTGDDSGIFYTWYYLNKKALFGFGKWEMIGAEAQGITDCYRTGMYKCMVWDSSTGKYTWSNIAVVGKELVFKEAGIEHMWSRSARFYFSFDGGIGPYTIELHKIWRQMDDSGSHITETDVLVYSIIIPDTAGIQRITDDLPFVQYFIWPDSDGVMHQYSEGSKYYMVVTDTGNNRRESSVVYYDQENHKAGFTTK